GREQARTLAGVLRDTPLSAIYSSDLRRAEETARIVGDARGLEPEPRSQLREIDGGEWSGLTFPEIEARYPDAVRRQREGGDGWQEGEPHAVMQERIVAAVRQIASERPGESVLLVIHGGTMRALMAAAEGVDFPTYRRNHTGNSFENGSYVRIAVENGELTRLD